jgi:O-methyltransferase
MITTSWKDLLKAVLPPILVGAVRSLRRRGTVDQGRTVFDLPDHEFYAPYFSPWNGFGDFKGVMAEVSPHTVVTPESMYVLYTLAQQAYELPGNFWECGVYKGGSAIMLKSVVSSVSKKQKALHLFDTFYGMPETDSNYDNYCRLGDFSDTSLEMVRARVSNDVNIFYHPGLIPDTFSGLEAERIAFAHVDVDIYQAVTDCCRFIYPRVSGGGFIVFDDYGRPTCAGARRAVDEFFADKSEYPLVLPTGQAIVIKLP